MKVVVFDVQSLVDTDSGRNVLETELRVILEDAKIRKVCTALQVRDHQMPCANCKTSVFRETRGGWPLTCVVRS